MRAVKAQFDGQNVIVPKDLQGTAPGEVILVFPDVPDDTGETLEWTKAQEAAFARAWDNDEDAVYDSL